MKYTVTFKLVKKVIISLDLSKKSDPDYFPAVVLKNGEPELSYILAELFNMCLKESCFSNGWKVLICRPCISDCWGEVYSD